MRHIPNILWTLFSIGVHLAIGMACYAGFVADLIDTSSAQFWAWLGAWPVMLIVIFWGALLKGLLWTVGALVGLTVAVWLFSKISEIRMERQLHKRVAERYPEVAKAARDRGAVK